jgi:hypothetical protein
MTQVIIYKQDNGVISVVYPTQEAVEAVGIEAIAAKDVPTGRPYKIIEATDLPTSRGQRMGWTVDDAILTDGVGA